MLDPTPGDTLVDEGGNTAYWLAAAWSFDDIDREYDWLELTPEKLSDVWLRCRWTTPQELANPDFLNDLFGDFEMTGVDTSVAYESAKPGAADAHRYLTTEGR